MYLGLLNLSILLVFGIAGLKATIRFQGGGMPARTGQQYASFRMPAGITGDREAAEAVRAHLHIPAVEFNVGRDSNNNLRCSFYTPNGPYYVTALEKENRLEIAVHRSGMLSFFDNIHAMSSRSARDWRVRLWAAYNEFSIWSLTAMSLSGVYLWLASRPRFRWAQIFFVTGSASFLTLYYFSR